MVGSGTALHHLHSGEVDIDSPIAARGLWAMEDRIDRSKAIPKADAKTKVRGFWPPKDWNDFSRADGAVDARQKPDRPFRIMPMLHEFALHGFEAACAITVVTNLSAW